MGYRMIVQTPIESFLPTPVAWRREGDAVYSVGIPDESSSRPMTDAEFAVAKSLQTVAASVWLVPCRVIATTSLLQLSCINASYAREAS